MRIVKNFLWLFLLPILLFPSIAFSQRNTPIKTFVSAIDSFSNRVAAEKVFLQIDKPYYNSGDTIWMKAYVLDATLNYSRQSGLLYTELINDTGKVIIRQCMPVKLGLSFGQMALDSEAIKEGSYTLRAYTNWMQNQGGQSFFTRQVYISKAVDNAWLVKAASKASYKTGKDNTEVALQILTQNGNPVRLREMRLKIMNGNRVLSKDDVQTDIDGKLNFNFDLPAASKKLNIITEDLRKGAGNKKLLIPVTVNRPENTDLQFMPEGGQLVAGLLSHVGFKAIGEDGKGTVISGTIVDSKGNVIAPFKSAYLGMGSFELLPKANETYTARVNLADGSIKTYPLPVVKTSGITLHIDNQEKSDSLNITLNATPEIMNSNNDYYLIAQSGGKVCYAAKLSFTDGAIVGRINKQRFFSGTTRFTLFDANDKPIAERLAFIDHHDNLSISLRPDKQTHQPKDSIALQLSVLDKDNNPVQGSFSLAITDDSQVKADSTNVPNVKSYMLLTGDLKGEVEQPGYYFDDKNTGRDIALDNLMITQGWIGYNWKDVFSPHYQPPFNAEPEIEVKGHITRTGGKAVGNLPIMLLSTKKPIIMMDTLSDVNGKFVFENFPRIDTANFLLQVKDKKGKIFEAHINVDEFTPADASMLNTMPLKPWYVNTDNTLLNYINQSRAYVKEFDKFKYPEGSRQLKEVIIKGRKVIKGSHFFAGYGAVPDLVLDEQDMRKANKMTLEELLMKKVPGFMSRPIPCDIPKAFDYTIFCNPALISFDGVPIDFNYNPSGHGESSYTEHYDFQRSYLNMLTAEDVRGIEIKDGENTAYIEITTWSGNGEFMKRTHGCYLYHPLPVTWPIQFYHPKYIAKRDNALADLSSTVYWEPNIITDASGKAILWFYAKGNPANYTAIIQGSNLNGAVGSNSVKICVK